MSYSYANFRPKTAEDLAKFFKKRNEIESLFEEGVIHRYGKLEVLGSGQIGRADPILQAPFESFTCRVCVSNDADGETTIDYNDPRAALDVYVLYDSGFLRMVKDLAGYGSDKVSVPVFNPYRCGLVVLPTGLTDEMPSFSAYLADMKAGAVGKIPRSEAVKHGYTSFRMTSKKLMGDGNVSKTTQRATPWRWRYEVSAPSIWTAPEDAWIVANILKNMRNVV